MNVVIFNDTAHVNGGAARVAIMNAQHLAGRGHQVYFFSAVKPTALELTGSPNITLICSDQRELLSNPSRVAAFVQGWWNLKSHKLAEALFATLDARDTVVHLHMWAKALSSSVTSVAIRRGFPVVCTLHDFLLACPTGTLFNHPKQEICHLKPLSAACIRSNCDTRSYPQKLWRVGRQIVQQTFGQIPSGISHYVAFSTLAADVMRPYLPASSRIHKVPCWIEASRAAPARPATQVDFVYAGRLVKEKGVLMLARCAAREDLPLTFIGDGELAPEILASKADAHITGWLDHQASLLRLRGARCLVLPSLWYETLGLVVLEAAANGIPSIVPDTSAASEFVQDGVTGLHFRGGDEADLQRQMRKMADPELVSSLGSSAYKYFWESGHSSMEAHIDGLEVVYQMALARA